MSRPLLLDLFCGGGGASMGYHRAGFDVVGVDLQPQPHYPFRFVQADALAPPFDLAAFDAIHASPPCQAYTRATDWGRDRRGDHPRLIDVTRDMLRAAGVPYVIENVEDARHDLVDPVMLCGSMFGLPIRRHRYFEAPDLFALLPPCAHSRSDFVFDHGTSGTPESVYRDVGMGCDWMTVYESRQAIPPAYTEWIGKRLVEALTMTPTAGREPEETT